MIVNSGFLRVSRNEIDLTSQFYSKNWNDSKDNLSRLGINGSGSNGFQGFIYRMIIYDDPDTDSGSLLNALNLGCLLASCLGVCPQETDQCIPDCEDPLKTSDCNQNCNCGGKSCRSNDPDSCISCHEDCNGLCTQSMDSNSCAGSPMDYCSPYQYDPVSESCSFDPTCVNNCDLCYKTSECQDCSPGYYLTPSKLCSAVCPSGYYPNGEVCEECHSDCSECTGPSNSECTACTDSKRTAVSGTCKCSESYFEDSGACKECHVSCKECTGPSSSDCTSCKDSLVQLSNGECSCEEGFQMNDSGVCESICGKGFQMKSGKCESICGEAEFYEESAKSCVACHSDCETCAGSSKYDCKTCKDTNAQVNQENTCECKEQYYAGSNSPLTCSECPKNCKVCNSEECLECLSGYQVYKGKCSNETENFFEVTAELETNERIKLAFSRNLGTYLNESQVSIELKEQTSVVVSINLHPVSVIEYLLDLNYSKTLNQSDTLTLRLDPELKSQSGASLLSNEIELELELEILSSESEEESFNRKVFYWVLGGIALLILFFRNTKGYFWVFLNTAQLVSLFALVTQELPSELYGFFMFFAPDFIPNAGEWLYLDNSNPNPHSWNSYGFTSSLFLLNAGEMASFALVFCTIFSCVVLAYLLFKPTAYRTAIQKKLRRFKRSHSIRLWLEVYVFVAAAALISLQEIPNLSSAGFTTILNFSLGAFFGLLVVTTPFLLTVLLQKNKQRIFSPDQQFNNSIKTLLNEFREESGVSGLMYHPVFCLRRLLLVAGLFYLQGKLQVITGATLSLGMLLFLVKYFPFQGRLLNLMNVVGEALILVVWMILLIYSTDISSRTVQILNWVVILSISVFLGTSFLLFLTCSLFVKTPKTSPVQPEAALPTDSYSKCNASPTSKDLFTPVPFSFEFKDPKPYRNENPLALKSIREEDHP